MEKQISSALDRNHLLNFSFQKRNVIKLMTGNTYRNHTSYNFESIIHLLLTNSRIGPICCKTVTLGSEANTTTVFKAST